MPWQPPRLVRVPLVRTRAGALGVLASTANAAFVCVRALGFYVHRVQPASCFLCVYQVLVGGKAVRLVSACHETC